MDPEALRRSARLSQSGAEHDGSRVTDRGLDPDYISRLEHFPDFSHEQIHDCVQAMNPADMQRAAQTWITIADNMFGAAGTLHFTVQSALSDGMAGHLADAADAAARRFVRDATDVAEITHGTGHRILAAAYGAEALRKTVPPPPTHGSTADRTDQYHLALAALDANYVPIYPPAGASIPAFFPITTPGDGAADPELVDRNTSSTTDSNQTAVAPANDLYAPAPVSNRWPQPSDEPPEGSQPSGSTPTAPNPQASQRTPDPGAPNASDARNREDGYQPDPSDIETRPTTFTPVTTPASPSSPTTPGYPRIDPPIADPGRSFPGPLNSELTQPKTAPLPGALDSPATNIPPGMFAPGTRATPDPDTAHRCPPWLIRDRTAELLGDPLPHVPQTIGAEFVAARNDLEPIEGDVG